ncbi:MAG: hypothetical protein JO218_05425 [Burkholderiales bacterium]|nr:hypothetical protein [Burkholderiales bacterium]
MSETIYLLTICLPLATVLVIFGMKYFAASQQVKAQLANEDAYRQIAVNAAQAQADTANAVAAINGALTDMGARLAAIEKILKQVE